MGKTLRDDGFLEYSGLWWALALPQVVLGITLSVVGLLSWWALERFGAGGGWRLGAGLALGLACWTLFEYGMHRWLLHDTRHPWRRRIFWKGLHAEHHGYRSMADPDPHAVHPVLIVPLFALLSGAVVLATEGGWGPALLAGWIVGYGLYEGLHWLFHTGDAGHTRLGRLPVVRGLWEAHTVHHLHKVDRNYGFVTRFWDRLLGTYLPLEAARARRAAGQPLGSDRGRAPDELARTR